MAITTAYRTRSDAVALRSFKTKGRPSAIAGMGVYAPEKVVSNFDLEKLMDTSDKWITERTGIKERHILKGKGLGTSHMGAEAVRGLLEKTNTAPKEVDLLICGRRSLTAGVTGE